VAIVETKDYVAIVVWAVIQRSNFEVELSLLLLTFLEEAGFALDLVLEAFDHSEILTCSTCSLFQELSINESNEWPVSLSF
jgi:hypothetical protein